MSIKHKHDSTVPMRGFVNQRFFDGKYMMCLGKDTRENGGLTHIVNHKLGNHWGNYVTSMCNKSRVLDMDRIDGQFDLISVDCEDCLKAYEHYLEETNRIMKERNFHKYRK